MASVRSAHKSCLVAEQGSLKPHNLVSQTLNSAQEKPFFGSANVKLEFSQALNSAQEKPFLGSANVKLESTTNYFSSDLAFSQSGVSDKS